MASRFNRNNNSNPASRLFLLLACVFLVVGILARIDAGNVYAVLWEALSLAVFVSVVIYFALNPRLLTQSMSDIVTDIDSVESRKTSWGDRILLRVTLALAIGFVAVTILNWLE